MMITSPCLPKGQGCPSLPKSSTKQTKASEAENLGSKWEIHLMFDYPSPKPLIGLSSHCGLLDYLLFFFELLDLRSPI